MRLLKFLKETIRGFFRKADRFEVLIGAGSESKGSIRAAGTVRIEGRHIGNVVANHIIILEKAFVRGDMQSRQVIIGGTLEGNVSADELVEVKRTGRIDGDVDSRRLSVAAGGVFNGYAHIYINTEQMPAHIDSKAAIT